MKLIKQSFEILEQKDFTIKGIKQFIERCARVSYKSEDRITDNSYIKFVDMLEKRDHSRPLEFGTVHLKMKLGEFIDLQESLVNIGIYNDYWIRYNDDLVFKYEENNTVDCVYITTNYRYYKEIVNNFPWVESYFDPSNDPVYYPKKYTVHMVLSRGVIDDFRTHVGLSHLAESTRYVNYSKDKFGKELNIILPANWDNYTYKQQHEFNFAWTQAEECYMKLIDTGCAPQQAREVLPLSIKSELISCGFKDAWANFIRRRSPKYGDPEAPPMAAEIANKIGEEFIKKGYINEKEILCRRYSY